MADLCHGFSGTVSWLIPPLDLGNGGPFRGRGRSPGPKTREIFTLRSDDVLINTRPPGVGQSEQSAGATEPGGGAGDRSWAGRLHPGPADRLASTKRRGRLGHATASCRFQVLGPTLRLHVIDPHLDRDTGGSRALPRSRSRRGSGRSRAVIARVAHAPHRSTKRKQVHRPGEPLARALGS